MAGITESMFEDTCLDWLDELGWRRIYGPDIAPDTSNNDGNKDWLALNQPTVIEKSAAGRLAITSRAAALCFASSPTR